MTAPIYREQSWEQQNIKEPTLHERGNPTELDENL